MRRPMLLVRDFPHSTLRHSVLRFQPAEIDIPAPRPVDLA